MAEHRGRAALDATRAAIIAASMVVLAACSRQISPLVEPKSSAVALTGGPGTSLVYLARTTDGVIGIDLGWWGGRSAVRAALRELDASPAQVTDVFLTHSHRDHIGSWRLVRRSRFHVTEAEREQLFGDRPYGGWVPRLADRIKSNGAPKPNEIDTRSFSRDTTFVFGSDTLWAFVVPGHTAGSAAYVFRRVLFLGDAATYTPWGGFGSARRGYSDDVGVAADNLSALWSRLPDGVRYVCTAHAHCRAYTPELVDKLSPRARHQGTSASKSGTM